MFHIIIYLRFGILNSQCLPTYTTESDEVLSTARVYHDSGLGLLKKKIFTILCSSI